MLHGQVRYNIPSRFINEVPGDQIAWLSPPRRRSRDAFDVDSAEWGTRERAAPAWAMSSGNRTTERNEALGPFWRIGQSVRHAKFGLGVIIDTEGRGADARVQVNFRDGGVKWLALEYAKLETA